MGENRKKVNSILRRTAAHAKHVKRQRELQEPETCICGVPGCHRYPPTQMPSYADPPFAEKDE